MKLSRRTLFKRGGILAVASAPLFIPSANLDFGVPRALALPEPEPIVQAPAEPMVRTVVLRPDANGIPRFMPIELTVSAYTELARSELYAANAQQAEMNANSVRENDPFLWQPGFMFDHGVRDNGDGSLTLDPDAMV